MAPEKQAPRAKGLPLAGFPDTLVITGIEALGPSPPFHAAMEEFLATKPLVRTCGGPCQAFSRRAVRGVGGRDQHDPGRYQQQSQPLGGAETFAEKVPARDRHQQVER